MAKLYRLFILSLFFMTVFAVQSCKKDDPSKPFDYALQIIPDINKIVPKDLLMAFDTAWDGVNLYFGDNPPKFTDFFPYDDNDSIKIEPGTCFFSDSLRLLKFIHNTDIDSTSLYKKDDFSHFTTPYYFMFQDQHKGTASYYVYERIHLDEHIGSTDLYLSEYAIKRDSIYIMGNNLDGTFTAFFMQTRTFKATNVNTSIPKGLKVNESVIISGKVTNVGITDFRMGTRIEGYSQSSPLIGSDGQGGLPQVHDKFLYDYFEMVLPYDSAYYFKNSKPKP